MNPTIILGSGKDRRVIVAPLSVDRIQRERDVEELKNYICRPQLIRKK